MENIEKELTIDFRALWRLVKDRKWFITIFSFMVGLITAITLFLKPNEYTSVASVMPELESSSSGGLGKFAGLASLAGIDLSTIATSDAVRPDLYPNIINNTPFFLYLLDQKVKTSDGQTFSFLTFYKKAYEIDEDPSNAFSFSLIESLRKLLGIESKQIVATSDMKGQVIYLSEEKGEIIEVLQEKIVASMDKKTGVISISVELPDPLTAAHVAQISMKYLTDFVTNYRTEKARLDVEFLSQRLSEAKGKFYNVQARKAQYSDKFQADLMRLQTADVQRERIESDYKVSSTFYNQLLQQYESAKIKVQEQTPVFKTLQQPIVPYEKSGPRRLIFVLASIIFGVVLAILLSIIQTKRYSEIIK